MGREIRMVPPDWTHPEDGHGRPRPLLDGDYNEHAADWDDEYAEWMRGDHKHQDDIGEDFASWAGSRPSPTDYMPTWPDGVATKMVLYETTSEGTPLSPKFDTVEEVAAWAADNASTFASFKATREQWLDMLNRDFVHHDTGQGIVFL